jgi:hypothetical protein
MVNVWRGSLWTPSRAYRHESGEGWWSQTAILVVQFIEILLYVYNIFVLMKTTPPSLFIWWITYTLHDGYCLTYMLEMHNFWFWKKIVKTYKSNKRFNLQNILMFKTFVLFNINDVSYFFVKSLGTNTLASCMHVHQICLGSTCQALIMRKLSLRFIVWEYLFNSVIFKAS